PSDIYRLTEAEVSQLDGFKEKSVRNLLTSIERSKNVSLERFIMALGIKHVGAGTAELLANKSGSIDALAALSSENLLKIEGIGSVVAQSVVDYFSNAENREEVARLLELGVKPEAVQVKTFEGHLFEGKTFVLTGTLPNYTRGAAATLIKERGGKVTDS